jgi:hypothetical protein
MGGLQTFAASAKSKGQREESGRSGYQPVFTVVQTQLTTAVSPCLRVENRFQNPMLLVFD